MGRRRTRARQLAKLAQRRAAERRRRRRQRILAGVVAFAVAIGGGAFAVITFLGNGDEKKPAAKPTQSTPTPTPTKTRSTDVPDCGKKFPQDEPKPEDFHPYSEPPPLTVDEDKEYIATITTSCGVMQFELFPKEAPETVNSFVFLAKEDYFDDTYFHRIAREIDVIQGGDPTGSGMGGPGYTLPDEWEGSDLKLEVGSLAMANSGQPHSGGSQFFIITGPKGTSLPPNYTVFGKILPGGSLKVARTIEKIPVDGFPPDSETADGRPTQAVFIENVYVKAKEPGKG